jgi:hypothetical protein
VGDRIRRIPELEIVRLCPYQLRSRFPHLFQRFNDRFFRLLLQVRDESIDAGPEIVED